jgi:hypothetical protein
MKCPKTALGYYNYAENRFQKERKRKGERTIKS